MIYDSVKTYSEFEGIVKKIQLGRKELFFEIEKTYGKKLYFYIYHLIGSKEDGEDVLQNVFIKAFEKIHSFDTSRQFSSWIYRIAHNEAINWMKRNRKRYTISWEDVSSAKDKIEISLEDESLEEKWERKELSAKIRSALKRLPHKYREVLILRFYLEKSYEEIGKIIGKPRNTVGTLINRAKKRMTVLLGKI